MLAITVRCMHMMSWQSCWCSKTMKWRPCCCTKPILWEFNSFLMKTLSFVPIDLHGCQAREHIRIKYCCCYTLLLFIHLLIFFACLVFPFAQGGHLSKHVKKIFLASKPPPVIQSVFKGMIYYYCKLCFFIEAALEISDVRNKLLCSNLHVCLVLGSGFYSCLVFIYSCDFS